MMAEPSTFLFASAREAVGALLNELNPVDVIRTGLVDASGLFLSRCVHSDRDSPPHDVSAMDGYAVCSDTLGGLPATLQVVAEVPMGRPAPAMPGRGCLKIGTGACVPPSCDAVLPREQVEERPGRITLPAGLTIRKGQHIRRRGENAPQGQHILDAGSEITPGVASCLAAFGQAEVDVHRPVRVALLTTGDELLPVHATPEPWQIRDSNTPALLAGLSNRPWVRVVGHRHIEDRRDAVAEAIHSYTTQADLIITTGGVSMGDHDYLKPALTDVGGTVVYHKLPIRPGKPSLGGWAIGERGADTAQRVPVIALPGNPVAVIVGLQLFANPVARALAGSSKPMPARPSVHVINPPDKTLKLWHYLPARLVDHGEAELIASRGSGDMVASAQADGFVEIPPGARGRGPWVFYDAAR